MSPVADSTYTKIIRSELPAHRVWEDNDFIAILDIHPVQRGHVLLIPKQQIDSIYDLDETTYINLWKRVRWLASPLRVATGAKRIGIVVEGLCVPHVHVHLVPVFRSNDLDPNKQQSASDHELAQVAETIRKAIASEMEA
jgi:histidine triad (HIT) family protein